MDEVNKVRRSGMILSPDVVILVFTCWLESAWKTQSSQTLKILFSREFTGGDGYSTVHCWCVWSGLKRHEEWTGRLK